MTARLHHYIPRFYLKGFANDRGRKAQLLVVDGKTKRSFRTSPRNVAAEKDFLRLDAPGLAPDALEAAMAKVEGKFASSLRNIVAAGAFRNENDRAYIFNFMALLAIRNPRWRGQMTRFQQDMAHKLMGLTLATRERWESTERKARAAGALDGTKKISYDEAKEFFERGEYTIEVPTMRHIQQEMRLLDTVLPYFFRRKWMFIKAMPGQGHFITSDHPVCLMWSDPKERGATMYGPGFGLPDTDVLFPLTKDLALAGRFEGEESVVRAHKLAIAAFNGAVIACSKRQVFASNAEFAYVMTTTEPPLTGANLQRDPRFIRPRTRGA